MIRQVRKTAAVIFVLLLSGHLMAQQESSQSVDLALAENWYQIEILVFVRTSAKAVAQDNSELLWHRDTRRITPNANALTPAKDIRRPPRNLEELNSLSNSLEYSPQARVVPAGSTVELEDITLWLATIRNRHTRQNSLAAIADPRTLGQYWPYIEPMEIPEITFDNRAFSEFDADTSLDISELIDEQPAVTVEAEKAFRMLAGDRFQLRGEARRIRQAKGYRIVVHRAWHQPIPERGRGIPVLIGSEIEPTANDPLIGEITTDRERFVHVGVRLWYRNANLQAPPTAAETWLTINSKLRMQDGEVHYIDHPYIGALVTVTPWQTNQN